VLFSGRDCGEEKKIAALNKQSSNSKTTIAKQQ
jgi:hypothetical protein